MRLKYAGIEAAVIENIEDALPPGGAAAGTLPADAAVTPLRTTRPSPVHAA